MVFLEGDYLTTVRSTAVEAITRTPEKLEDLAREAQLEDLIAQNWSQIAWGAPLKLYSDGDQTGRQFSVGRWNIDFLAVDAKTNELVVIELKRGRPSVAALGQLLAYIQRVRAEVAKPGQKRQGNSSRP